MNSNSDMSISVPTPSSTISLTRSGLIKSLLRIAPLPFVRACCVSGDGPGKVPSVEGDNDCGFPLMNIRAMAHEPPCPGKPAPQEGR